MRHLLFLSFSILFLSLLPGAASMQTEPHPLLKSYQWQNRLLLVFAPEVDGTLYRQQLKELQNQVEGLKERDLLIFHVFSDHILLPNGIALDDSQAQSLRANFIIPSKETVTLLIDKDGTEKLRSRDLLSRERLFLTIDAMSMRQQEMERDSQE